MDNSNNEAKRIVYAEGLNLETALKLSNTYKNVVFLTDDQKTSGSDLTPYEDKYIDNTTWKLGINIVKNGIQYIPIAGIHPLHNSFKSSGFIYNINVQEGTNLLCISEELIKTRGIYVGYNADENTSGKDGGVIGYILSSISDTEQSNVTNPYQGRYIMYEIQHDSDPDNIVYLYIIKNENDNEKYDGCLLVYNNLSSLYKASRPLSLLNYNVSGTDITDTIYTLSGNGTFSFSTGTYIEDLEPSQAVWSNSGGQIDILIPEEHVNSINIINTLTNNENAQFDPESSELLITNSNLTTPFIYDITDVTQGEITLNTINYKKFNLVNSSSVEVTGVAVKVKNV